MVLSFRSRLGVLLLSALFGLGLAAETASAAPSKPGASAVSTRAGALKPTGAVSVYIFRGIFGIFSYGMDTLQDRLTERGIRAKVLGHTQWRDVIAEISEEAARHKKGAFPVVLVGHSLGGNAALMLGKTLIDKGIPVDLVITVDPTVSKPVSTGVRRYLDIYQKDNGIGEALDNPGLPPSRLENFNAREHPAMNGPEVRHGTLDKNAMTQQMMVDAIVKVVRH